MDGGKESYKGCATVAACLEELIRAIRILSCLYLCNLFLWTASNLQVLCCYREKSQQLRACPKVVVSHSGNSCGLIHNYIWYTYVILTSSARQNPCSDLAQVQARLHQISSESVQRFRNKWTLDEIVFLGGNSEHEGARDHPVSQTWWWRLSRWREIKTQC